MRPLTPDTCAARSQRQSTSSCGHGRRSTNKEKARSKASTGTPPDCTSHGSGSVVTIRRHIFSWPVSRGLCGLCNDSTRALAAAKPHLTQPARYVMRAVQRPSCTYIGYVLEICLIIPMKRRSMRINDHPAEHRQRQPTHPACGSEAFSQPSILQGCCHRQPRRRLQCPPEHLHHARLSHSKPPAVLVHRRQRWEIWP